MWDAAKTNQKWDVGEFRRRKAGSPGVIVIFDRVRDAPIAHTPSCSYVTEERFMQKMVEMEGKNGRYWWSNGSPTPSALSGLGAALVADRRRTCGDRTVADDRLVPRLLEGIAEP